MNPIARMSRAFVGRRGLFGLVAWASAVVSTWLRPRPLLAAPSPGNKLKRRWGMVIDLDRCTGCGACVVACQEENNIPTIAPNLDRNGTQIEWMSQLWKEPKEDFGLPELLPFPCQHCADAPCVKVCPVGATTLDPEGLVTQVPERCIGCRYCMVACPYGRRFFNWVEPKWDDVSQQVLNPDVATRPAGVVEKCTFCSHRIKSVKERARLENRDVKNEEVERLTACATVCPGQAITFGDLHDPESTVARQARSPRVFRLLEELGTQPGVLYLKRDRRP